MPAFCRGLLEREGFTRYLVKSASSHIGYRDCRIVIDMRDSNYILESTDIPIVVEDIVENFSSRDSSLALVSAPGVEYFRQLVLSQRDFNIEVFTDIDPAASWLAAASFV